VDKSQPGPFPTLGQSHRATQESPSETSNSELGGSGVAEPGIEWILGESALFSHEAPCSVDGRLLSPPRETLTWPPPQNNVRENVETGIWGATSSSGQTKSSARRGLVELQEEYNIIHALLPTNPLELLSPIMTEPTRIYHPHDLAPSLIQNTESGAVRQNRSQLVSLPILGEIAAAEMPDGVRILVSHWQNHVCHLMMPTLAPSQNPWLRLYLPLAMQEPRSKSKNCLLYSILATTAFNMAQIVPDDKTKFQGQAKEYKSKAEDLLESLVEELCTRGADVKDDADKQALLAAALTMTSVEVSVAFIPRCY
jgi:hypothetical protein